MSKFFEVFYYYFFIYIYTSLIVFYQIVVYTASLSKYADPLLDILDPTRVSLLNYQIKEDNLIFFTNIFILQTIISRRLFREHCVYYEGHYVKDLTSLGVDLSQAILVDNSPMSYIFHPGMILNNKLNTKYLTYI